MGSLCDGSHGTTLTVRKFTRLTVLKKFRSNFRPYAWCVHFDGSNSCTANFTSVV